MTHSRYEIQHIVSSKYEATDKSKKLTIYPALIQRRFFVLYWPCHSQACPGNLKIAALNRGGSILAPKCDLGGAWGPAAGAFWGDNAT